MCQRQCRLTSLCEWVCLLGFFERAKDVGLSVCWSSKRHLVIHHLGDGRLNLLLLLRTVHTRKRHNYTNTHMQKTESEIHENCHFTLLYIKKKCTQKLYVNFTSSCNEMASNMQLKKRKYCNILQSLPIHAVRCDFFFGPLKNTLVKMAPPYTVHNIQ